MQDDAVVARNFAPVLERIVERYPGSVICLWAGGGAITKAFIPISPRYSVLRNGWYLPCVGILWPRAKALDVLEWEQTSPKKIVPNDKSDDGFLGLWAKRRAEQVLVTTPCLVQHPDDVPSVLERDERRAKMRALNGQDVRRRAFDFIGHRDPLALEW